MTNQRCSLSCPQESILSGRSKPFTRLNPDIFEYSICVKMFTNVTLWSKPFTRLKPVGISPKGTLLAADANPRWGNIWSLTAGHQGSRLGCIGEIIFLVFFCKSPTGIKGAKDQMLPWKVPNHPKTLPMGILYESRLKIFSFWWSHCSFIALPHLIWHTLRFNDILCGLMWACCDHRAANCV